METQFVANDTEDLTRVARIASGLFSALGVDMGAINDGYLSNPTDRFQVVDTYRGAATAGRTATAAPTLAGITFTPGLILLGLGAAWLLLRK